MLKKNKEIKELEKRVKTLESIVDFHVQRDKIKENPPKIIMIEFGQNWVLDHRYLTKMYDINLNEIPKGIFNYHSGYVVNKKHEEPEIIPEEITGLGLTYKKDDEGFFRIVEDDKEK